MVKCVLSLCSAPHSVPPRIKHSFEGKRKRPAAASIDADVEELEGSPLLRGGWCVELWSQLGKLAILPKLNLCLPYRQFHSWKPEENKHACTPGDFVHSRFIHASLNPVA